MKKLLTLLLAMMMVFSLAACGNPSGNGGEDSISQKDLDEALDKVKQLIPEGWDENKYGAYIYDVWDSDFLPDCFPAAPDGIKVDQTTFKDYDHDTLNGSYGVGALNYESKEAYREYGVSFYANKNQLDSFVAAVEAKGLVGGLTDEGEWTFYDYFGNGWYMQIFVRNALSNEDYEYLVNVNATDSLFELPKAIDGIPLPQVGMTTGDYSAGYTIQDYTDGYEDVDFDLSKDKLPEQNYAAWFNYLCATNQDAKDYAQQLKNLGWTVEWESDSENGYRCCLKKDNVYAVSNYYTYDCLLEVGFSDVVECLSY